MESIRAVELVRSIRDGHYERLKNSTPQEKIAFFQEKARRLHMELGKPEALGGSSSDLRAKPRH